MISTVYRKAPTSHMLSAKQVQAYITGSAASHQPIKLTFLGTPWDCLKDNVVNHGKKQRFLTQFHTSFTEAVTKYYKDIFSKTYAMARPLTRSQSLRQLTPDEQVSLPIVSFDEEIGKDVVLEDSIFISEAEKQALDQIETEPLASGKLQSSKPRPITRSQSLRQLNADEYVSLPVLGVDKGSGHPVLVEDSVFISHAEKEDLKKLESEQLASEYVKPEESYTSATQQLLVRFTLLVQHIPECERKAYSLKLEYTDRDPVETYTLSLCRDGKPFHNVKVPKYNSKEALSRDYCSVVFEITRMKFELVLTEQPLLSPEKYLKDRCSKVEQSASGRENLNCLGISPFKQTVIIRSIRPDGNDWILNVEFANRQKAELTLSHEEYLSLKAELKPKSEYPSLEYLFKVHLKTFNEHKFNSFYLPIIENLGSMLNVSPDRKDLAPFFTPYLEVFDPIYVGDIPLSTYIRGPRFTPLKTSWD
ncbi:hypothetical protein [Parashewanella tropica]|uniref:hypothetical protein n=1 Tax=Parashewanella tropica TaxID=2547970 RepID=UPI0010592414|nr:hypothetical protein [Parashewanella tropica]